MEIVFLFTGLLIGAAAAWFICSYKNKISAGVSSEEYELIKNELNSVQNEKGRAEERNKIFDDSQKQFQAELTEERNKVFELNSLLSSSKAEYKNVQLKLEEQKADIVNLQEKFSKEFENLASKIFEEKSTKFTIQNKENIDSILRPLNEKIKDFEKKVEEVYVNDSKERATLFQQIKTLHELNQQMSKDATNLTNALKGQTKTQGNWGEFILETILEKSGLVKGREYLVQESITTTDGKRFQPDVIIKLPESKTLIIDSKVSLNAYERFVSSEVESDRAANVKEHITSIRNHIKNLSSKNYQNLYELKSLDFVLMFLPIEPALSLAIQNDMNLFNEAFEKNIVIVSPSTLLATLRTIASIWRQEHQNKNALDIARQSGALYDKFVGLLEDLKSVGEKIKATQNSYEDAMKKLSTGRGNLIGSVEKIKRLGAKTTKAVPQNLLDSVEQDDELTEQL